MSEQPSKEDFRNVAVWCMESFTVTSPCDVLIKILNTKVELMVVSYFYIRLVEILINAHQTNNLIFTDSKFETK